MTAHENNQLDSVNKKIDRILSYLENDPSTGSKGLVERTKDLENQVNQIEVKDKVKRAKLTGFTVLGSGVLTVLIWVFEHFII